MTMGKCTVRRAKPQLLHARNHHTSRHRPTIAHTRDRVQPTSPKIVMIQSSTGSNAVLTSLLHVSHFARVLASMRPCSNIMCLFSCIQTRFAAVAAHARPSTSTINVYGLSCVCLVSPLRSQHHLYPCHSHVFFSLLLHEQNRICKALEIVFSQC